MAFLVFALRRRAEAEGESYDLSGDGLDKYHFGS